MNDKYILDGHTPVPVDLQTWARWFEENYRMRHVADQEIDGVRISTVFLALDHRFGDAGPPLLFETMIFGGPHDQYQDRCSTWEQAETMHATALALVRAGSTVSGSRT